MQKSEIVEVTDIKKMPCATGDGEKRLLVSPADGVNATWPQGFTGLNCSRPFLFVITICFIRVPVRVLISGKVIRTGTRIALGNTSR